ncbi:MAG: hypothetical protein EP312_04615 [Gammaproteobacteria bacterium]|nr:MAG: hypothetical protein EP312_04615 [Gammaproteobacteria bacterium]
MATLLEDGSVAIYPAAPYKPSGANKRHKHGTVPEALADMAFLYKLDVSQYPGLSMASVRDILINETVWLDSSASKVKKESGELLIRLKEEGQVIQPDFLGVTQMPKTPSKTMTITTQVSHHRQVYVSHGGLMEDPRYLYRIPLTPIAAAADAAIIGTYVTSALVLFLPAAAAATIFCVMTKCFP